MLRSAKKSKPRSKKKITKRKQLVAFKQKRTRLFYGLVTTLAIAVVGTIIVALSSAYSSTAACGQRVNPYNYQVPFGKNAVWNQPVCNLPVYPQSADYASRFFNWSHVNKGDPKDDVRNGFISANPGFANPPTLTDPEGLAGLFTREVYYASDATTEKKVASISQPSNLDGAKWQSPSTFPKAGHASNHPEAKIPWNPAWKSSRGGDNEIFILDDRPGKEGRIYTIWGYNTNNCIFDAAIFPDRVCGASIDVGRDHYGNMIDYRTHEGYVSERGVGLSYYATLTTPDEVAAGEIRHALGVAIPNTSWGAICTKQQLGTSAEGRTCGTAVAPASKFEWGGEPSNSVMKEEFKAFYGLDKSIPEGMRFAIRASDKQIEDWVNSRPELKNNPRRAETARIFARALRDYGMIVVDTNGARPDIQMVGGLNPQHAEKWKNLAMGPEQKDDLLAGLVTSTNLYVVDPPTLTCADGSKSKNYCKWTAAKYETTVSQAPNAPTTPIETNQLPRVSLATLQPSYTQPTNIPITASASDSDGSIAKVEFFNGSVKLGEVVGSGSTYTYSWKNAPVGMHSITARATDNRGATATTIAMRTSITPPSAGPAVGTPPPSNITKSLQVDWTKFRYAVVLKWTPPASTAGIADYQVQRDGRLIGSPKTNTFTDSASLSAGITYNYTIIAKDNKGALSRPGTTAVKADCFLFWCSLSQ